jgi:hypothetical protein
MTDSTASETCSKVVSLARNHLISFLRNHMVSLARNQVVNFTGISTEWSESFADHFPVASRVLLGGSS